uniref:Uncharacterized protein n=1 Tax=Amphimedon queenslandica TaxID=400682 RepID=A0A1X7UN27_AMPQE
MSRSPSPDSPADTTGDALQPPEGAPILPLAILLPAPILLPAGDDIGPPAPVALVVLHAAEAPVVPPAAVAPLVPQAGPVAPWSPKPLYLLWCLLPL